MIPYGKQNVSEADVKAVVDVLHSDWLTQGPVVPQFERAIADYCSADLGVATNSATSALHLACLTLGLGPGDCLWTTPNTFVASANCALYCGAKVDFVDIDPVTYNLSVDQLEQKLINAKALNKLPKIVIPVHFAGQSCDMRRIHQLSQDFGFKVVEDASHAIGGKYLDQPVGDCHYSDITVFSFHPVKIITTAEGGLATTNQPGLAEKMRLLRSHGVTRDEQLMSKPSEGDWYYQQVDLGFNYRMTEIQAALGLSQLSRLDDFVALRHQRARFYNQRLREFPLILPKQSCDSFSSLHIYPVLFESPKLRNEAFDFCRQKQIGVNVHYIPVHTQPYYQRMGFEFGQLPAAEYYYAHTLSLPLHPQLSDSEQAYIVDTLHEFFRLH